MIPRALVTGCAGFIGSHLAESLLQDGTTVLGVDCFNDTHFVQTVLVVVRRIVDVVVSTSMLVEPEVVWVNVTGQTVVETVVSTVVMTS